MRSFPITFTLQDYQGHLPFDYDTFDKAMKWPKRLKKKKPSKGQILLFRKGKYGTLVGTFDLDACELNYELQQHEWTHWMPMPKI